MEVTRTDSIEAGQGSSIRVRFDSLVSLRALLTDFAMLCSYYSREKEREEIEARRALPEALRMKEDTERAQKSRDEKKKGGQGAFRSMFRCCRVLTQSSSLLSLCSLHAKVSPQGSVLHRALHHLSSLSSLTLH